MGVVVHPDRQLQRSAMNRPSSTCIQSAASVSGGLTRVPSPMRGPVMLTPTPNSGRRSAPHGLQQLLHQFRQPRRDPFQRQRERGELAHAAHLPGEVDQHHRDAIDHQRHSHAVRVVGHQTQLDAGLAATSPQQRAELEQPMYNQQVDDALGARNAEPAGARQIGTRHLAGVRIRPSNARSLEPAACPSLRRR